MNPSPDKSPLQEAMVNAQKAIRAFEEERGHKIAPMQVFQMAWGMCIEAERVSPTLAPSRLSDEPPVSDTDDIPNSVLVLMMNAWESTLGSPYTRYAAMYRVAASFPSATRLTGWVEVEKAKADAYEAAATICEEMSYPPEGQERWHGTDNEWAAIKLEDAAKAIRERKAKVCHVTQAIARSDEGTKDG